MSRQRYNKFGNRRTEYSGRNFASKHEAETAQSLDMRRFATDPHERVTNIEYQVRIPLMVKGYRVCFYVADFRVTFGDGRVEIWDAKGYRTQEYKLKRSLYRAIFGTDIIEV